MAKIFLSEISKWLGMIMEIVLKLKNLDKVMIHEYALRLSCALFALFYLITGGRDLLMLRSIVGTRPKNSPIML